MLFKLIPMILMAISMCPLDNPDDLIAISVCSTDNPYDNPYDLKMISKLLKLCVESDKGLNIDSKLLSLIHREGLKLPEDTDLFDIINHLAYNSPEARNMISLFNIGKRDLAFSAEMNECLKNKHGALNKLFKTLMSKEESKNTRYMLAQLAKCAKIDGRDCKYDSRLVLRNLRKWFNHLKDERDFEVPLFYLLRKCYPISAFEQYMLCRYLGLGEQFLKNLLQVRASVLSSHNACTSKINIDSSYMVVLIEACILSFILIPQMGFEAPKIEWFMENFVKHADFGNALEVLRDFVTFSLQRKDIGEEIDELLSKDDIFRSNRGLGQSTQDNLYSKVTARFDKGSKLIFYDFKSSLALA